MTSLPKFRRHSGNSGYIEGWALYAEQLGKEVGFYQDPVSDYGRLSSELFRAVRLVVDTGLHSEGWSRDQVVEFFRKYQPVDEPTIQSETDRYIAWPAQALSYKLGQLKFRELRERAKKELGPKFDIRSFHDEMLNGGVLPLDLLDARTNSWIQATESEGSIRGELSVRVAGSLEARPHCSPGVSPRGGQDELIAVGILEDREFAPGLFFRRLVEFDAPRLELPVGSIDIIAGECAVEKRADPALMAFWGKEHHARRPNSRCATRSSAARR